MRGEHRFMTGLVLILTMSVSLVETVWASACSPIMGEIMGAAGDGMEDMGEMGRVQHQQHTSGASMPADHDCMPGHPQEPSDKGDGGPPCPFSPAGAAQGCAATASLPPAVASVSPPSPIDVIIEPCSEVTPHLLRAATIFHPPKA